MTKYLLVIIAVLLIVLVYDAFRIYFLFQKSASLVEQSSPFNRIVKDASFRILVLGDSTAVGTGSSDTKDSTAGRLAQKYPDAEVVNRAVNGLRIAGLEDILKTIDQNERFDIVLIQIGANDIMRFTSMKDIESGIDQVLARTEKFGGKVVVLHSGDIGDAEFFPWYIRPLLSKRSFEVREIYKKIAPLYGAEYVDLISSPVSRLLEENPDLYYANDSLHLSGEGYGLWYQEIVVKLQ